MRPVNVSKDVVKSWEILESMVMGLARLQVTTSATKRSVGDDCCDGAWVCVVGVDGSDLCSEWSLPQDSSLSEGEAYSSSLDVCGNVRSKNIRRAEKMFIIHNTELILSLRACWSIVLPRYDPWLTRRPTPPESFTTPKILTFFHEDPYFCFEAAWFEPGGSRMDARAETRTPVLNINDMRTVRCWLWYESDHDIFTAKVMSNDSVCPRNKISPKTYPKIIKYCTKYCLEKYPTRSIFNPTCRIWASAH